ncbi:MAG TPA: hypothetical protein VGM39_00385 [Kofleriaceae bacterium]|jgi:hypothetical protein
MTISKSKASRSSALLAIVGALALWLVPSIAEAGRKRVVVLDFEGPKAEQFHDDVVKVVKKSATVIPAEKWSSKAEELDAEKVTDGNVKKVAKKLKLDAVITGRIEKRRDKYIIQIKVRNGKTGTIAGQRIDVTSDGPELEGDAKKDLKDELIGAIDTLKSDDDDEGSSDDSEDSDEPKKSKKELAAEKKKKEEEEAAAKAEEEAAAAKEAKKKKHDEDEGDDEDKPKHKKKGFGGGDMDEAAALKTHGEGDDEGDDEDKPKHKKHSEEGDEDEDNKSKKKKKKKIADSGDDESVEEHSDDGEEDTDVNMLGPGERAVDAALGLSFTARKLSFNTKAGVMNVPPPYNGVPVAGADIDVSVFPLAIGHKNKSALRGLGITGFYDKVIKIESKAQNISLPTKESRFGLGVVFRYPLGNLVVGGMFRVGKQSFTIGSAGGVEPALPDTEYTIFEPSAFVKYAVGQKVTVGVMGGFLGITNTGEIQQMDQYGAATVTGAEVEAGLDVMLTKNVLVRATFRFEQIGYKFKGVGAQVERDNDPSSPDVGGAADRYIGGTVLAGYLY